MTSSAHKLWAHWLEPVKINVTFNANGGKVEGESTKVIQETVGSKYILPQDAVLDNYDFVGWYTKQEGGSLVDADTIVYQGTDHELFAHWAPSTIEVEFKVDDVTYDKKTETVGSKYVLPVQPTKQYKNFAGW